MELFAPALGSSVPNVLVDGINSLVHVGFLSRCHLAVANSENEFTFSAWVLTHVERKQAEQYRLAGATSLGF